MWWREGGSREPRMYRYVCVRTHRLHRYTDEREKKERDERHVGTQTYLRTGGNRERGRKERDILSLCGLSFFLFYRMCRQGRPADGQRETATCLHIRFSTHEGALLPRFPEFSNKTGKKGLLAVEHTSKASPILNGGSAGGRNMTSAAERMFGAPEDQKQEHSTCCM